MVLVWSWLRKCDLEDMSVEEYMVSGGFPLQCTCEWCSKVQLPY